MMNEEIYRKATELADANVACAMITIVETTGSAPRHPGTKMLVCRNGEIFGTIGGSIIEATSIELAKECIAKNKTLLREFDITGKDLSGENALDMSCGGNVKVFIEPVGNIEKLIIFGGGHICLPVYRICLLLGFKITVVDDRLEFSNSSRFPDADVVVAEDYSAVFDDLKIDANTYVVIVTHGPSYDKACLRSALGTSAKYIGMIASKTKLAKVKKSLIEEGIPEKLFSRLHSPIGLEIDAETPEEIAVSIAAELVKVRRS